MKTLLFIILSSLVIGEVLACLIYELVPSWTNWLLYATFPFTILVLTVLALVLYDGRRRKK